jgi:TBC1 domain family member 10
MYNEEVGYTQGMNYVMGFILLVSGGKEEETFWFFVSLAQGNESHFSPGIEQFYTEGFPLYYQYVEHFNNIFESQLPEVKTHFDTLDYSGPVWLQKWFITLFLYSFPLTY